MLQVRESEISLRKWSGGTTRLRIVEGTLHTTSKGSKVVGSFNYRFAK